MKALRLIYEKPPESIPLPEEFRHGSVEIIIMPFTKSDAESPITALTSSSWLADFAGAWKGFPLMREPQGQYEVRDELK